MANDLFEQQTPEIDPNVNYFEALVGEGKKYKDPAAAGKALVDKDNFIEQLKRETAELRKELSTRTSMEAFLDNLKKTQTSPTAPENTQVTTPVQIQQSNEQTKSELSLDAVEKLLNEREARQRAENNLNEVTKKLKDAFGANYPTVLEQKAAEFNLSKEAMNDLARQNPAAFLHLVGANTQSRTPNGTLPNGTSRPALPDTGTTKKNAAYYAKLRKENPSLYWSSRIQVEEHQAAMADPDGFFSN